MPARFVRLPFELEPVAAPLIMAAVRLLDEHRAVSAVLQLLAVDALSRLLASHVVELVHGGADSLFSLLELLDLLDPLRPWLEVLVFLLPVLVAVEALGGVVKLRE